MKLIIGLVGRIGSGKGLVSDYLCDKYNAKQYMFSKILMDLLDRLHLPHERKYLQELGVCIRKGLGEDTLVNALQEDLKKEKSDLIVIDGIRYQNEVEMLRKFENNILLYLRAPPELRYERCRKRAKKGEAYITFEEFLNAEDKETERYIEEIGKTADYTLENTGTKEELIERVEEILGEIGVFRGI